MDYFFSHIGYILLGGLFIAGICIVWSFAAMKWHAELEEEGIDHVAHCNKEGCAGCSFMAKCGKERDD
jgi:hypothetical protein